jgi:hypothetical protein
MNPAKKLGGAKTFFAQAFAKNGQAFKVKFKKVGRHGGKKKVLVRELIAVAD